jgi:hypothetical protein
MDRSLPAVMLHNFGNSHLSDLTDDELIESVEEEVKKLKKLTR